MITFCIEPVTDDLPLPTLRMAEAAWVEIEEFRLQPQEIFVNGVLESLEDGSVQYVLRSHGQIVACAVVTTEYDMHVGYCRSIQWNYCLPNYRDLNWMARVLRQLKSEAGALPIAYTHRVGARKYILKYTYSKTLVEELPWVRRPENV